ncbi:MAG TPA: MFS transporter [Streptosporangiaceae bacterium]|jgi:MFS family permease
MTAAEGIGGPGGHDGGAVGLAVRRRAPFYRYWLSGFLSDFGDGVRLAALPLLAARLTGSPAAVAAVTAVQGLPWLVLGPGAGVIVDRVDRRRLMVAVDSARAATVAALAAAILTRADGLALIYLAAFAAGFGSALRGTAAITCVPRLVDSADLERANGRVIAGQIVGYELAGPAAGGWLFGMAAVLPFAVNAGTLGIAVLLLLTLPSVFRPEPAEPDSPPGRASVRLDLAEGLAWLRGHADIRDLTVAVGVISAMDAAWFAILVLYVTRILHQRPGAYGALLAIGAVGGIAAGGAGSRVTRRLGMWQVLLLAGLVAAASQFVLGLTASVVVAAVMLAVSSAALALFNMTAVTMRQRLVPGRLLGRVSSLYGTVAGGSEALGALAGGVLATVTGVRATMLLGAIPIAAVSILTAWRHRGAQRPRGATWRGRARR